MAENATQRRLTAILSMDVKGYSKLMDDDDESTVNTITAYRMVISELIQKQHGRVVDTPGDNILAEFGSALNAVNAAVDIQHTLDIENSKLPKNRRMVFRIGINVGDILHKDNCIYGDGVNVAARIESLADPGGICISRGVFEQVKKKIRQGLEYLGEHTVKNISEPVKIYRILLAPEDEGKFIGEPSQPKTKSKKPFTVVAAVILICSAVILWMFYPKAPEIEPASKEKMAYPLPDKPSIAVLPFDNMSGDPNQAYFCDGLTEEIITALSKVPKVFVIARNSVFTYKGKPIKVSQVAEELGIRYVLEGSVRKGGDKLRITAQLIDAVSGHHLWAERYDRDLKDIFAVQDELTKKIITAMQVELTWGEQARVDAKGTENLQAYLKFLEAREAVNKLNIEANALGRQLALKAIELDPQYAKPYRILAATYRMDVILGNSKSPKESMGKCIELLKKAIELDATYAEAYGALGFTLSLLGQHEKAVTTAEQAVALDPNSATTYAMLGHTLRLADRPKEAIQAYSKAIRLNPIPPTFYQFGLGMSYGLDGQYEKGIQWCEKAVKQNPDDFFARLMLTTVYSMAGQDEKARAEAKEVLRINPKYSLAKAEKRAKIKYKDKWFAALRKAGLADNEPIQKPAKPTIAVLPFKYLSDNSDQKYIADGVTENIITALSKISEMLVISRNSVFTYKDKPHKIKQVGKDLGVSYVLEGSIQKSGNQLRVTGQLIDATTDHHLWADQYDRKIEDLFAIQDEITMHIVSALQVELTEGEQARLRHRSTNNLRAWSYAVKGYSLYERITKDDNAAARNLFKEAIDIDSKYAWAWTMLGNTYFIDTRYGWHRSRDKSYEKSLESAQKALEIDESIPETHALIGLLKIWKKDYDGAIDAAEKAVSLGPSSAEIHAELGMLYRYVGRFEESIRMTEKAIRLHPYYPDWYLYSLEYSYYYLGQHEKAVAIAKKHLELIKERGGTDTFWQHFILAQNYIRIGQIEEAQYHAAEGLRQNPDYTFKWEREGSMYKDPALIEQQIEDLRKAGLTCEGE
ncbi:MAG: tetratricopeptide repeat protein [Desulfosarcina sp.]|jgi:adenylate cyclase